MVLCKGLWNDPGPDRGWSWVVAFSCCWITTGMFGIVRSSGFLYVAVIENFGITRKEASLPFAVMLSFSNFIGLFGSILLQFASMRQIVIGGSVLGCAGVALCYFARSVHWITFSIGVLTGSGIGLSTSFLTVILSQYFVKSRTTANGIWLSGRSISGFLFPPLIFVLLTTFGLRGTFLILGGILSNTLIGAGFLRPRTPKHFPLKLPSKVSNEESQHFLPHNGRTTEDHDVQATQLENGTSKIAVSNEESIRNEENHQFLPHHDDHVIKSRYHTLHAEYDVNDCDKEANLNAKNELNNFPFKQSKGSDDNHCFIAHNGQPLDYNAQTLRYIPPGAENGTSECEVVVNLKKKRLHQQNTFFKRCSKYLKTCLHLLRNPVYILNILTDSYHAFTITATGLTLVDFSLDSGFSMNMALMILLALNISDLVARIFTGFISDRGYLSRPTLIAMALSGSGAALFTVTLVHSVFAVLVLCAVYGMMMGCAIINIVAFYTEYMTPDELPIGIGVGNFIKGFIFLLQSVLIGFFRDQVGSYIYLYYFFAFLAPALGLLWTLVLILQKCRLRRENADKGLKRTSIN